MQGAHGKGAGADGGVEHADVGDGADDGGALGVGEQGIGVGDVVVEEVAEALREAHLPGAADIPVSGGRTDRNVRATRDCSSGCGGRTDRNVRATRDCSSGCGGRTDRNVRATRDCSSGCGGRTDRNVRATGYGFGLVEPVFISTQPRFPWVAGNILLEAQIFRFIAHDAVIVLAEPERAARAQYPVGGASAAALDAPDQCAELMAGQRFNEQMHVGRHYDGAMQPMTFTVETQQGIHQRLTNVRAGQGPGTISRVKPFLYLVAETRIVGLLLLR